MVRLCAEFFGSAAEREPFCVCGVCLLPVFCMWCESMKCVLTYPGTFSGCSGAPICVKRICRHYTCHGISALKGSPQCTSMYTLVRCVNCVVSCVNEGCSKDEDIGACFGFVRESCGSRLSLTYFKTHQGEMRKDQSHAYAKRGATAVVGTEPAINGGHF